MSMNTLETRSQDERAAAQLQAAQEIFPDAGLTSLADLAGLPVMRKDALCRGQAAHPPFGAVPARNVSHIFQSPGPIYEPGSTRPDFWRMGRFLAAMGFDASDVAQNTFAYHFTPAGMMFESAARAIGMVVFPAGPGQTLQQAEVAAAIGTTAYIGTP
ncbi:phenylacetate--CoA ligase family protein, partial [Yoonia sp.]|uniref:phenylacetate--CoA ligase family protein n=1 Tax=Yoonia sp. TaxID=2212373 RepID=UPI002DF95CCA|nr:phenylacetate--CoA ligase family protein [Yoonia sp.]